MLESNLNALMPFDFTGIRQRHPTIKEKTREKAKKGLECRFLLTHVILRPFKGIFVRTNII